ncbi:MAG: hypothetical protein ACI89M_001249, partial [Chitinophagales bacterium]
SRECEQYPPLALHIPIIFKGPSKQALLYL